MIETGWLVETHTHGFAEWLAIVDDNFGFTIDSLKAIRFARKEDGERLRDFLFKGRNAQSIDVTEHSWG